MKVLSLFSGIGAFEKALDRIGVEYELVNFCEFDKYAVKSYCAIHGADESKNLGDITKVDESSLPNDIDLITYGFPCQDISLAGKQKGLFNADGTQTRSGLFFDALRIIEATKPKIAIAENVKNLTSKKFALQFKIVLDSLKSAGYNNYFAVLNAKNYGIPQNRERVLIVSIRSDIDNGLFEFPEPFNLKLRLKDLLDDDVDEKFYLSAANMKWLEEHNQRHEEKGTGFRFKPKDPETDCASTLRANASFAPTDNAVVVPECKQVGQIYGFSKEPNPQAGRIYDADGISPTMDTCSGGNRMPKVLIPQATKQGFIECEIGGVADLSYPNSKTRRGRVQECGTISPTLTAESSGICRIEPNVMTPKRTEYGKAVRKAYEAGEISESRHNMTELQPRTDGVANTLTTVLKDNYVCEPSFRIRKLTPKECFRLMGFDDSDFEKAEAVNSNSQLYKQAGNSIVVDVLEHVFKSLFEAVPEFSHIFTKIKDGGVLK